MATKIIMPKLGMAMTEGVIAKWHKNDGEPVEKEEVIAVIMSKKITYKLIAPDSGILRIVAREKETRPVAAVLAFIAKPGESLPDVEAIAPAVAAADVAAATASSEPAPVLPPAKPGFVLASPAARRLAKEKGIDLGLVTASGANGMVSEADVLRAVEAQVKPEAPVEVLATSAAKKLAQERGVNLAQVSGTGSGGRVTEQDVLDFIASKSAAPAPAVIAAPATPAAPSARTIPFVGMRQAVAEHMMSSLHSMAQLTMMIEVDATELVKLRTQLKADMDLTFTDLLVKAVSKALARHPLLNATLVGDEIQLLDAIHIGIAVALPDGLIVPVLRNADRRTVPEIAQELRRLAQCARDGSLGVDEVTGSTFTITNLGNYGIDGFTPIINAPEVAILGVGRIAEKPVVLNGEFAKRSMMTLSLTLDHRIVDGAPGAEFMRTLKELVESPYRLLA